MMGDQQYFGKAGDRTLDARCGLIGIYAQRKSGSGISLHGSNIEPFMSALAQKRTFTHLRPMSALPPKADIG
jgi:hypothetical protein